MFLDFLYVGLENIFQFETSFGYSTTLNAKNFALSQFQILFFVSRKYKNFLAQFFTITNIGELVYKMQILFR